jgi:hypothetical protein
VDYDKDIAGICNKATKDGTCLNAFLFSCPVRISVLPKYLINSKPEHLFPTFVSISCIYNVNEGNGSTVKLGYNELGYDEHSVITKRF